MNFFRNICAGLAITASLTNVAMAETKKPNMAVDLVTLHTDNYPEMLKFYHLPSCTGDHRIPSSIGFRHRAPNHAAPAVWNFPCAGPWPVERPGRRPCNIVRSMLDQMFQEGLNACIFMSVQCRFSTVGFVAPWNTSPHSPGRPSILLS